MGAGTKDFLPGDMRARAWLFGLWTRVGEQFGFEMVEGPVLESEDLFVRKAGEEIVGQLYNFQVSQSRLLLSRLLMALHRDPGQIVATGSAPCFHAGCAGGGAGQGWAARGAAPRAHPHAGTPGPAEGEGPLPACQVVPGDRRPRRRTASAPARLCQHCSLILNGSHFLRQRWHRVVRM